MTTSRSLAKRRSLRRAKDGGAIIFIVSMTLALLATVGGFALMSSTTEARTAGFERRALQSQYLAEYGLIATTQNMTGEMAESLKAMALNPTYRAQDCANLRAVPILENTDNARACVLLGQQDVTQSWANTSTIAFRSKSGTVPGALGLSRPNSDDGAGRALGLDFYVQLTEPTSIVVPSGFSLNGAGLNWCSIRFTVDSFGITRPDIIASAVDANETQRFAGAGLAVSRGYIISPPRKCP
jgi:hypothetical protein